MKQTAVSITKNILEEIRPSDEKVKEIERDLCVFLRKFEKNLKKLKIKSEIFIGGSYAKDTMIKKKIYDIDIFVRYTEKKKDISLLTKKVLKNFNYKVVHGSRDYFQINITKNIIFEIIPVQKITKPKDAENITDLSYSHVKYIKKKIKSKKILDEIRLAKAFCYANRCYGAESYINGFSGYALELLVYHYKSFLAFIQTMSKTKEKVIIDIEKLHKNKQSILMDLNSSKLNSPIILIDPTHKQRNVAAALSEETFKKFQKICKAFLKNPSAKAFEQEKIDLEKIKKDTQKKGFESILLKAETDRQSGDIAGSKLLKFQRHLSEEIKKYFEIKNKIFDYDYGKTAKYFFVVKSKKEILIAGPSIADKKNSQRFKKKHKKTFVKNGRIYSKEWVALSANEFIKRWKIKNRRKMQEMGISELRII